MRRSKLVPVCLVVVHCCLHAQQTPEPIKLVALTFSGSIRSRVESWDWSTAANADHAYTYDGSTVLRLCRGKGGDPARSSVGHA